jgi:hypothetical protein
MLYMSKYKRVNTMEPFEGSSGDVGNHMIVRYDKKQDVRHFGDVDILGDALAQLGPQDHAATSPLKPDRSSPAPVRHNIEKCEWYTRKINSWDSTAAIFDSPVNVYSVAPTALCGDVNLRLAHGTVCPYAGRNHLHNNLYIRFREQDRSGEVICYDEECLPALNFHPIRICAGGLSGAQMAAEDGLNDHTLHSQQDGIHWNEIYNEERMRPLPDREIVCVRANMGVGKTVALIQLFKKACTKHTKVLVISYNRSLSAQMAARLSAESGFDFTNYQDVQGPIQTPRIVVCLDSLARIHTSNFDYVIVDETTSVIKHFNSQHMASTGTICSRFELLAIQAKRVYFLDAVIDTTSTVAVVDYLARFKCTDVYWIWNQYVRPSNREVTLIKGPMGTPKHLTTSTIIYAATQEIIQLLKEGSNVVVPSSTASYTKFLKKVLLQELPDVPVKVYNSDEPSVQLANIHTEWPKYRCLVYSPTISAGVSYEGKHFDYLVAVLCNSRFTPPVDEALQQLWRVRNLNKGGMTIYLSDREVDKTLPSSYTDVTELLDTNIALAAKYCDVNFDAVTLVDGSSIKYDASRLSYQIIVGIVSSLNKSIKNFSHLLAETLITDYKLPVAYKSLSVDGRHDLDIAKLMDLANIETAVDFKDIDVNLSSYQRDRIHDDLQNASDLEKANMKLYDMRNMYDVDPSLIDKKFFKEYAQHKNAVNTFYTAKRFRDLWKYTLAENKERLAEKLALFEEIDGDRNFDLFKSKTLDYHKILTSGHDLLKQVVGADGISSLTALKSVPVHEDKVVEVLGDFIGSLSEKERKDFKSTFKTRGTAPKAILDMVLQNGFGLTLQRGSENNKNCQHKQLIISHAWIGEFEASYKPATPFSTPE